MLTELFGSPSGVIVACVVVCVILWLVGRSLAWLWSVMTDLAGPQELRTPPAGAGGPDVGLRLQGSSGKGLSMVSSACAKTPTPFIQAINLLLWICQMVVMLVGFPFDFVGQHLRGAYWGISQKRRRMMGEPLWQEHDLLLGHRKPRDSREIQEAIQKIIDEERR
jgi:hypothetical protein